MGKRRRRLDAARPTLDHAQALTLADLDLTARAAASNVRMASLTIDEITDNQDGTATITVSIRMADGQRLHADGQLEHGWHVVQWTEPARQTRRAP